jgi:hypothetical protein
VGYYRSGDESLDPWAPPAVPVPDPIGGQASNFMNLLAAYGRMTRAPVDATARRNEMGYYRAGDEWSPPSWPGSSSSSDPMSLYTPGATTPARSDWKDPGGDPFHRKRPRMHVTNTKALRRAMRRVTGFAKVARKVMTFTSHHKLKRSRRRK